MKKMHVRCPFAVFLVFILDIGNDSSCFRFVPSRFGLPTPRDIIELDASPSTVGDTWKISGSSCSMLEDRDDGHAFLECEHAGLHSITRTSKETAVNKYLTVVDHPYCYGWYAHHVKHWTIQDEPMHFDDNDDLADLPDVIKHMHQDNHRFDPYWEENEHKTMAHTRALSQDLPENDYLEYLLYRPHHTVDQFRLWVIDPHYVDEAERTGKASHPSPDSVRLTKQFKSLGEAPDVKVKTFGMARIHDEHLITEANFSQNGGYWETYIISMYSPMQVLMSLYGAHRAVNECFIKDTHIYLVPTIFQMRDESKPQTSRVSYRGPHKLPFFTKSPCARNVVLLITSAKDVLITQDSFRKSDPLLIQSVNQDPILEVDDIVLTNKFLVLQIGRTLYRVVDLNNETEAYPDILPENVSGINARQSCALEFGVRDMNDVILSWTDHAIYYMFDFKDGFVEVEVPQSYLTDRTKTSVAGAHIGDVQYSITVEIFYEFSSLCKVFQYIINTATWSELTSFLSTAAVDQFHTLKFIQDSPKFLIQGGQTIFLYDPITDKLSDAYTSAQGENVREFFLDVNHKTRFLVMKESEVLYGSLVSTQMLKIDLTEYLEGQAVPSLLWMDQQGDMYLVHGSGNRTLFPWESELNNAAHDDITCKDMEIKASPILHNFLDRSSEIQIWASGISSENVNRTILQSSYIHPADMVLTEEHYIAQIGHYRYENLSITLAVTPEYNGSIRIPSSDAIVSFVEISAVEEAVACESATALTRAVYMGCPPGKHVMIYRDHKHDEDNCKKFMNNNFSVTIKRDSFKDATGGEEKTIVYNYAEYGCPLRLSITELFWPRLVLYDDETFVKEVMVDFVLHEVFHHKGIRYMNTSGEVGCKRRPQTWSQMQNEHLKANASPNEDVWGSHNYVSCFMELEENVTQGGFGSVVYQVFNGTRQILIGPPIDGNSFLFFHAIIVDPKYSFCRLTTKFSIEVYGALPDLNLMLVAISLSTCVIIILLALVASYFYMRKQMLAGTGNFHIEESDDDY